MRILLLSLCLGLPVGALAQTATCASGFQADIPPGGSIDMELRSGDIQVLGADVSKVRITCESRNSSQTADVEIYFKRSNRSARLKVSGGPDNDLHYQIQVPTRVNLKIRCTAGNLTVKDVVGDKDVELNAGNLTIEVGDGHRYFHADAGVLAGNLEAPAFGISKDGLFRSFNKDNSDGRYRLHAHLLAGDLTLK